ncbi:MAG: hypothetical protein Kow00121_49120 [Elainellaceae cyanobacterium]
MFPKQPERNSALVKAVFSGLVFGLPIAAIATPAASAYPLNPCPSIYYEEPFNSTRQVPAGCPPNAATQELIQEGRIPVQAPGSTSLPPSNVPVSQPPLPEELQDAIATVIPTAGTVDIQMVNMTNAVIRYQAVGFTDERPLLGGETVLLQDLPVPVTITLVREDGGFIQTMAMPTTEAGLLSVSFDETTGSGIGDRTIRVQEDGQVFTN